MVLKTGAAEHEPLAGGLSSPPCLKKDVKGGGGEVKGAIQEHKNPEQKQKRGWRWMDRLKNHVTQQSRKNK